jgi:Transmembrane protein 43
MTDDDRGDSVTDVTTVGWGGRISSSLTGALFGILIVLGSVVLLYWNEGRAIAAIHALDQAARQVVEVAVGARNPSAEGKLVHLTGMMTTTQTVRDPVLGVGGAGLLRLRRKVEMFQWKEEQSTTHKKSLGGSETTRTTYTYHKEWSDQAIDSSQFRLAQKHYNPSFPIASTTIDSPDVRLGVYHVDPGLLASVSAFTPFLPHSAPAGYQKVGDELYRSRNSSNPQPGNPQIGDIRITFAAVRAQTMSVVAALASGVLAPFHGANGYRIALAAPGVVAASEMFREKKHEERLLTWALRGVGFLAMLIGFVLLLGPLSAVAAVLPFLEGIVEAGIFFVALMLAMPLTLLTIAVAWFAHRPLLSGGLIVVGIGLAMAIHRLRRRRPLPVHG